MWFLTSQTPWNCNFFLNIESNGFLECWSTYPFTPTLPYNFFFYRSQYIISTQRKTSTYISMVWVLSLPLNAKHVSHSPKSHAWYGYPMEKLVSFAKAHISLSQSVRHTEWLFCVLPCCCCTQGSQDVRIDLQPTGGTMPHGTSCQAIVESCLQRPALTPTNSANPASAL